MAVGSTDYLPLQSGCEVSISTMIGCVPSFAGAGMRSGFIPPFVRKATEVQKATEDGLLSAKTVELLSGTSSNALNRLMVWPPLASS